MNNKIESIRPKKLVDQAKTFYLKDVEFYSSNKDKFQSRSCPGCNEKNSKYFCSKDSFDFDRCKSCLSIFMNPGPTDYLVSELYSNSMNYYYWSNYMYPLTKDKRYEKLHIPRAEFITHALSASAQIGKKIRLLEMGAGDGGTLRALHELDARFELFAYEPNSSSAQLIDKSYVNLLNETQIRDQKDSKKFSAIVSFEVLEHLLNPSSIFSMANALLEPGGLLVCSTPNALSLEVGALRASSTTIDIEHISILSPVAISLLSSKFNLRILSIETPGEFDLELLQDDANFHLFDKFNPNEQKQFQCEIQNSLISSHMKFVAQKIFTE